MAGNLGVNFEKQLGVFPYGSLSPQFGLDWAAKLRAAAVGGEIAFY